MLQPRRATKWTTPIHYVPKNPPRCTKEPPVLYKKTPRLTKKPPGLYKKVPVFVAKNHPICTETPGFLQTKPLRDIKKIAKNPISDHKTPPNLPKTPSQNYSPQNPQPLTKKNPIFYPKKTPKRFKKTPQNPHFLPKNPIPYQKNQTFGRPYETPKEDSYQKKSHFVPRDLTKKLPVFLPTPPFFYQNPPLFTKKTPKPPTSYLKNPKSDQKNFCTTEMFERPCHTVHPYIIAPQTQSSKTRKEHPHRSNRLTNCCGMDKGICNPLFFGHLVYPYSLGCTTRICYVKTRAVHMKRAEKDRKKSNELPKQLNWCRCGEGDANA